MTIKHHVPASHANDLQYKHLSPVYSVNYYTQVSISTRLLNCNYCRQTRHPPPQSPWP